MYGANNLDVFNLAETLPFNDVHFWRDPDSQLEAIIAIHNTDLGPALGGCRFIQYPSSQQALVDALRLARGMTLKSAINQLPFGGGKAVILKPAKIRNRKALFEAFGQFVESLHGRYITAMDSGTQISDMNNIQHQTQHVVCTSTDKSTEYINQNAIEIASGDPSPYTAKGVYYGIKAAVKHQLQKSSLEDVHIAIQGAGHVGYQLASLLYNDGAELSISDINPQSLERVKKEFNANIIENEAIYQLPCDVFSPCALGQTINNQSIQQLQCKIIAGSANNQLAHDRIASMLQDKGILYAPDYVINSGGVLQIAYLKNETELQRKLIKLYDTLLTIFQQSTQLQQTTESIATQMAESYLHSAMKDRYQVPPVTINTV